MSVTLKSRTYFAPISFGLQQKEITQMRISFPPVSKRQQMPSPSNFKVDLSHHSNILHANKKVKHVLHIVSES